MNNGAFWEKILKTLQSEDSLALLYALESNGSSPGRQGFKMAVTKYGELTGSIGGGIMEHKLVELAIDKLIKNDQSVLLKRQIHSDKVEKERSGMICSGEQTVCLLLLDKSQKDVIKEIVNSLDNGKKQLLQITKKGISITTDGNFNEQFSYSFKHNDWQYLESLNFKNNIHIIGSGHVGLALARQMKWLGFYVKVYDDRSELNTFENNQYADDKIIIDYDQVGNQISKESDFVVLVSFGYRTDKVILKQLLKRDFKYLGMMGSKSKTATLMKELAEDGFSQEQLSKVHAPIGIEIQSKTPEEIAVSIAAQIIAIKNEA